MALKIMEKLRQEKKAKNMLSSLNLNKRKKIKMHDTIIKQLRALIKDWSLLTVPHRSLSKEQKDFFRSWHTHFRTSFLLPQYWKIAIHLICTNLELKDTYSTNQCSKLKVLYTSFRGSICTLNRSTQICSFLL